MKSSLAQNMISCNPDGPLMVHIVKLYPKADCSAFDAFGRVFSGTVREGATVKVLGEGYSLEDEEDMTVKEISKVWIGESRYRLEVPSVPAGNWVLLEGIDASIVKT